MVAALDDLRGGKSRYAWCQAAVELAIWESMSESMRELFEGSIRDRMEHVVRRKAEHNVRTSTRRVRRIRQEERERKAAAADMACAMAQLEYREDGVVVDVGEAIELGEVTKTGLWLRASRWDAMRIAVRVRADLRSGVEGVRVVLEGDKRWGKLVRKYLRDSE